MMKLTRDAILVGECLQLTVGPSVQNPVLDTGPGSLGLVLGLVPGTCDLSRESITVALSTFLDLDTLQLQVRGQLLDIPLLIRRDSIVVPVLLDKVREVLAVGGGGIGNAAGAMLVSSCTILQSNKMLGMGNN